MNGFIRLRMCLGCLLTLGAVAGLVVAVISCSTAPTPFLVAGPGVTGNDPPSLTIIEPITHVTVGRGDNFLIRWTDSDRDSNALISFVLVDTVANNEVVLVQNIPENDTVGPDSFTVSTSLLSVGTYNLVGVIDDGVNQATTAYAETTGGTVTQRVVVTIVEPGQGPPTQPPTVTVIEPAFNLSVSQEDELLVVVRPTAAEPVAGVTPAYDPDSDATLYILLDLDKDPNNDNPANPDPTQIIPLQERVITRGEINDITFSIIVDLNEIAPRGEGEPYYIRATIDDATNPRVHQYAVGSISVAQLAAGDVDLYDVGRTISGTRFYGFNPGAYVGSSVSGIGDFDADGVDDFVIVAQYGNPRNFGRVGEAYLVYGQVRARDGLEPTGLRFGGALAVNTISETIPGVIFEAPPVRNSFGTIPSSSARTDGISDIDFVPDLTGDGRPELLFGLRHVHGAIETSDFDPGDTDISADDTTVDVEIEFTSGTVRVTLDDELDSSDFYAGVDDLTISSAEPNTTTGSEDSLSWQDNGAGQRQWALIKFRDILQYIPDDPQNIDITSVSATLTFRVFGLGGDGAVHQCLTDFDERTAFSSFAVGGGEPQGGERNDPTADYVAGEGGEIGNVSGDSVDVVDVDVSDLLVEMIDGLLDEFDNELRLIIVPSADEGDDRTDVRSSEWSIDDDRPTLTLEYTRINFAGASGCYPDDIVNNRSDDENDIPPDDTYYYAGGMALMVNSQNRDNTELAGEINTARLDNTVVTLELVGQESDLVLDAYGIEQEGGGIFARADNSEAEELGNDPDQEGRIAGSRFVAGPYDWIDARVLRQGPREGWFGDKVAALGDVNNDGLSEIMISAPRNERYVADLFTNYGYQGTHWWSTIFKGSILVLPGTNYNQNDWRCRNEDDPGTATIPFLDHHRADPYGTCTSPPVPRHYWRPADAFQVFAENIDDMLGGAHSAGDFNQDGIDDILCGAPLNDRTVSTPDTGAAYVLYSRNVLGNFQLDRADDSLLRPPMLRIRGLKTGDKIGWVQDSGLDVNGDRIDDVFMASPATDYPASSTRTTCAGDFDSNGVIDSSDLSAVSFANCRDDYGEEVFSDDACKVFDYNNDRLIDDDDESIFDCLAAGGTSCCQNIFDNGFIAVIFGGVFIDGDRLISQIGTFDLPGAVFYGACPGDRAGYDVSSAGDFNHDGFGDLLISAPGAVGCDEEIPESTACEDVADVCRDLGGRPRLGVTYLILGGPHLEAESASERQNAWSLDEVGSSELPGIVFLSPYMMGRPNEAAPTSVALIGDINDDAFSDIAIGNPKADFIDLTFPQGPNATDAEVGRRRDAGDAYVIYGNNYGPNRTLP